MSLLDALSDFEIKTLQKLLDDRASKNLNGFAFEFEKGLLEKTGAKSLHELVGKLNNEVITVKHSTQQRHEELKNWLQDKRLKKFQLFTDQSVRVLDLSSKKYLYLNQANENLTGLSNKEFLSEGLKHTYSRIHPWDLLQLVFINKRVLQHFSEMTDEQRKNSKYTYDIRYKHPEKGYIRVLQNILPVSVTSEGELEVIIVLSTDITEMKRSKRIQYSFGYWQNDDFVTLFKGNTSAYGNILSKRELEILSLLAEGYTSPQVGEKLHVSPDTVRTHSKNIISKVHARNMTEVVKTAVMEGWI